MANKKLVGKKVAVLVEMGFEQSELTEPIKALKDEGAQVMIVSKHKKVKGWQKGQWADEFTTDVILGKAEPFEFDALLLPGGVMNPDRLRTDPDAVLFVKFFIETGRIVAAICHGPWTLIETGLISGRNVTSWPSLKTDLINAGAFWWDKEVVVDNGLITSRKPEDLPAFNKKLIEEILEGTHIPKEKSASLKNRSPVKGMGRLNENLDDRNWKEVDNERDMRLDF